MLRSFARLILQLGGWDAVGEIPKEPKIVGIAAPHTSNWDGFWLIAYKIANDLELHFLAKHTLFWWPLGNILRALGAIPIDRGVNSSTVEQVVNAFATHDRFWFALAPEGTRRHRPYWKTGFYRIAKAADVPIVLGFIDYADKRLGLGPTLHPGQSAEEDLAAIRDFYSQFTGRNPQNQSPIRFAPIDD